MSVDDNTITYFNFDAAYDPTDIFDIFVNELNLHAYYYTHDNNNIFLDTGKLNFVKYEQPNYKYFDSNSKDTILHENSVIDLKYNNDAVKILNDNIFKIYDCGYTVYSLQAKHTLYNNEMTAFLNISKIDYTVENNQYYFHTRSGMRYEICYIDSSKHSLNDIDKSYFFNLSLQSEQNNSFKMWVKDFEWNDPAKKEILKSYILHAAHKTIDRIYARDCEIVVVDGAVAREFEKKNCFYGSRGASLNLGMVLKKDRNSLKAGTLVMLYTFGYNFFAKKPGVIEIIRVGTLKYHSVVGGSSRLFRHFINNHEFLEVGKKSIQVNEIKFYSDYDHNIGGSLEDIGFTFVNYSKGGVMNYWVHTDEIKHRQPMKHSAVKSEIANGNVICVPNAGVKVFVYVKNII